MPRKAFDVFCAAGGTGRENRWALIDELRRRSPKLRYALHGRDKKVRLLGDAYYRVIEQSKVGLNLNGHEGGLYASDRMAQYLGNGLLLATSRRSGYQQYFNDDEMIFFEDAAELAGKVEWAIADDRRWRKMAERARAKAVTMMGGSSSLISSCAWCTVWASQRVGNSLARFIHESASRRALSKKPGTSWDSVPCVNVRDPSS